MKKNVLVFPCGSEIGLEIQRSVQYSIHFRLIGASSVDDHGRFAFKEYVGGLPFCDNVNFGSAISQVIREHGVDLIMPAHDSALLALARLAAAGDLGCRLVASPLHTCELTRSKRATYLRFRGLIPTPQIFEQLEAATFPVFLKPDVGQGSKGTYLAYTEAEAKFYLARDPSLIILEYLPGPEFTVDCFTDRAGDILYCSGRSRARIASGISVRSHPVEDHRFAEIAKEINAALDLRGAWFFQVKESRGGDLALLEIAPRVAGTMGLSRARGANLPLLGLFDALDLPVTVTVNPSRMTLDRSLRGLYQHDIEYERVYFDLDDTIILRGRVNPSIAAFIYQCRNKGVRLHLITRHKNNLEETLANMGLGGLFDELIWLREGEAKCRYIIPRKAIFVDDSWAERDTVAKAHGIPVFDSHMIEALMEPF